MWSLAFRQTRLTMSPHSVYSYSTTVGFLQLPSNDQKVPKLYNVPVDNTREVATIMSVFNKRGDYAKTLTMWEAMNSHKITPTSQTCLCAMKACTSLKKYSSALAIFEVAKQHKFKNISFFNAVLNIHHKKNQREKMEQVFREIFQEGLIPNTMTYNLMIDHYNKAGDFKSSESLLAIMSEKKIEPDNMTYGVIIDTCALRGDLASAELTFKKMSGDGTEPTGLTFKAIFNAYVKFGEFSKAEKIWREMTAAKGFLPDASMSETMLRVYNADGTPDFLAKGEKLFFQLKKNGVKLNDKASETMVEVFMKLGKRALAQELFKELKEKGRVTGDTVEEMIPLRKPTKIHVTKE